MKFWTSSRLRTVKERRLEAEAPAGVEIGAQKQEILNKEVECRLLGKNLCFFQRVQLAATGKQAGVDGRRIDEAAAKNEDYEGSDKENQIKRKNVR